MKNLLSCPLLQAATLAILACSPVVADEHVAIVGFAKEEYTQRKYENGKPRLETYVFMQGRFFEGRAVNHSIDRMTFRHLVEALAPELARQQYLPTTDLKAADLLLVVHWGTTIPLGTLAPLQGIANAPTHDEIVRSQAATDTADPTQQTADIDGMSRWNVSESEPYREVGFQQLDQAAEAGENDMKAANNAQLLGYTRDLGRLQKLAYESTTEATLLSDLASERYFIIIKAYDLKDPQPSGRGRRPVWTLHVNMRSPGQNFATALAKMGNVAVDYFGRTTGAVVTAQPHERAGKVTLGEMKIIGAVRDPVSGK